MKTLLLITTLALTGCESTPITPTAFTGSDALFPVALRP